MTPLDFLEVDVLGTEAVGQDRQSALAAAFQAVRATSRRLAAPLSAEDMTPQSMADASPVKWHLGHTAWFFETFVLKPLGVEEYDPVFNYLFNSYYEALGRRQPRAGRGLMTRPSVEEVMAYRAHIDRAMMRLFDERMLEASVLATIELGLAHEEQHQELLVTDVLHLLSQSPLHPAYKPKSTEAAVSPSVPLSYTAFDGGVVEVGHVGNGFAFDNEGPRHSVLLRPYRLANRLVTNAEWLEFMADGGYRRPEFWLSDGWAERQKQNWTAPLYWEGETGDWKVFGPGGLEALDPHRPVSHVSFYEADAYARWVGARLPLEAEWEHAANTGGGIGVFLDDEVLRPQPAKPGRLAQMFGDVWEWTASPYTAYPGFRPATGAVGEYNGKFMINQMILKGGSCFTPRRHIRASYRNFFQPEKRWQAMGLRLALD